MPKFKFGALTSNRGDSNSFPHESSIALLAAFSICIGLKNSHIQRFDVVSLDELQYKILQI